MQTKLCPCCHKRKDLDKFGKRKIGKVTYLQSQCIPCRGVKNPNAKNKKVKKSHTHTKNQNARKLVRTDRKRNSKPSNGTTGTKPQNKQPRSPSRRELEAKAAQLESILARLEAQLQ